MFHFSSETIKETYEQQKGHCAVCNNQLDLDNPESYFTQSYGRGEDRESNCFLLCPECHEQFVHGSLREVDYPDTKHGFEVKKYKNPVTGAILGAIFPRFGLLYVGVRFFLISWGIFFIISFISTNIYMPTYEGEIVFIVFLNVAYRTFTGILGYRMAKYQRKLLDDYVAENDLDPNCYGGKV